jgi:hypothetical protein
MAGQNAPGALINAALRRAWEAAKPHTKRAWEWLLEPMPSWWRWQWPGLRGIWQGLKLRPRIAVPVAVLIILLLVRFWHWYSFERTDHNGIKHHPHADILNPIAAALGAALLAWAAIRQARNSTDAAKAATEQANTASQVRLTESYSKAVEQLASDKMEERLGGIYTLERISKESPDDYWTVMETLTAFVREHASWKETERRVSERAYFLWQEAGRPDGCADEFWGAATAQTRSAEPQTDIAAVLTVIKRREEADREREAEKEWRFDLRDTDLRGARLWDAHFEGASLPRAHLENARLDGAHLEGAFLNAAHLKGAFVRYAQLQGAQLWDAHLEGAHLNGAHLEGANLRHADLKDAILNAHLEGADLTNATGLTTDMLAAASGNAHTKLPDGVARPAHWSSASAKPDASGAGEGT